VLGCRRKKFDKPWHLVGGSQVPEDEPELCQGAVKDVVVVKDDLVIEVIKRFYSSLTLLHNKLECFVPSNFFREGIIFEKWLGLYSEDVFLVVCDPSMNELRATYTGLCIDLYGSRSLTARS
jgi:hypothetical protein